MKVIVTCYLALLIFVGWFYWPSKSRHQFDSVTLPEGLEGQEIIVSGESFTTVNGNGSLIEVYHPSLALARNETYLFTCMKRGYWQVRTIYSIANYPFALVVTNK